MEDISTGLAVYNTLPTVFNTMNRSINFCIISFESLQQIMGRGMYTEEIYEACEGIENTTAAAQNLENQVKDIEPEAQKVASGFTAWDKAIEMGSKAVDFVKDKLEKIGVMDLSGAFNTLDASNLFSKTVTNMTGDANLADAALASLRSTVSGTAYGLDTASKSAQGFLTSGMSLGDATDQVRIWGDAVSFYGEGTNEQLESVVGAIGEMYSQGTVEPDQLNQLFDAGIGAAEIYAQSVNRSVSDVKDDLSNGAISAQEFIGTVSQALDSGASNGAAKSMEGSWKATFDQMRNSFTSGWVAIFDSVDTALASLGLPGAKEMVAGFGETVEQVMSLVANSMVTIAPLILGVATAIGIYAIATGISNIKTWLAVAANQALKATLLANPLTLIALLIGLLVLGIFKWVQSVGGIEIAWMIAMDSIKTATENLHIKFMDAWYGILNMLDFAKIMFSLAGIVIADYVGIMKVKVLMAMQDMINGCINLINDFIGTVNKIFGLNLELITTVSTIGSDAAESEARKHAQRMQDIYQQVNEAEENKNKRYSELAILQNKYDIQQSHRDSDIASRRNEIANKSSNEVTNANINSILNGSSNEAANANLNETLNESSNDAMNNSNSIAASSAATADNTDKIADSMDITDEDLKYLRDIAEREIIDRTVFQSLKVDMGGIANTVTNMADLDGIGEYLGDLITTTAAASMEG